MGKRARLIDVADEAGVSTATVSFVLSGSRRGRSQPASDETVRRVREAADRLGYVPNEHAKAIRTGYSTAVVLALGSPEDPWSANVAVEVQRRALGHGLSTLTLVDETWFQFLQGYSPRAAFITSTDFDPKGLRKVEQLVDQGANLVVFSTLANAERYDVISSSAYEPTKRAYRRLRGRHDRVHALSTLALDDRRPGPHRMSAYRDASLEHGDLAPETRVFATGSHLTAVASVCHRLLDDKPTAVICSTGYLATALRDVAMSRGLRMPDDIELIAIGDIPHNDASYLGPISHYGSPGSFDRIADIVVQRAVRQNQPPFARHDFAWEFIAGATTIQNG